MQRLNENECTFDAKLRLMEMQTARTALVDHLRVGWPKRATDISIMSRALSYVQAHTRTHTHKHVLKSESKFSNSHGKERD